MKLLTKSGSPASLPDWSGVRYHAIGVRIGRRVYGIGFATGGKRFRLFRRTEHGTYWLWRIAVCNARSNRTESDE